MRDRQAERRQRSRERRTDERARVAGHVQVDQPVDRSSAAPDGVRLAARPEDRAGGPLEQLRGDEDDDDRRDEQQRERRQHQHARDGDEGPVREPTEQHGIARRKASWLTAEVATRKPTAAAS